LNHSELLKSGRDIYGFEFYNLLIDFSEKFCSDNPSKIYLEALFKTGNLEDIVNLMGFTE